MLYPIQAFVGRDATTVPEKYKENFDVSSEGPLSGVTKACSIIIATTYTGTDSSRLYPIHASRKCSALAIQAFRVIEILLQMRHIYKTIQFE
jgi:hypothetical protein